MKTFDAPFCCLKGFTRTKDYVFITCCEESIKSIRIYENTVPFDLLMLIPLEEIVYPRVIVSSPTSECLYVTDLHSPCIWKLTIEGPVTKWICSRARKLSVTVATNGQVVVLQFNDSFVDTFVEILTSDGVLIRTINLQNDLWIQHAILKPNGQLVIVVHSSANSANGSVTWSISLVTNNGQIIDHVTITDENYFYTKTVSCWSLDLTVAHVNDSDLKSYSECFASKHDAYLMLEEHIFPLAPSWYTNGRTRNKIILLDAQVGIHSSENSIAIHKAFT